MSDLKKELEDLLGVTESNRKARVAYLFKRGDSIKNLAKQFDLRFYEVEDCVRNYMASDERFEDVEDEDEDVEDEDEEDEE